MNKKQLEEQIRIASGKEKADLVMKNAKVVNVFSLEVIEADVAVHNGLIAGVGNYSGKQEVDVNGQYMVPGLVDGHVHIESSMVQPQRFAQVVVPHGVTTIVTDPHEIANVSGAQGVQFMLDDSAGISLDANFMLPSCVPATPFENAGAKLTAVDLRTFYSHERVLGLAEVMDYPSVENTAPDMMDKLMDAGNKRGHIDGHGAGLPEAKLNVYRTAGVKTDHECTTAEEAKARIRAGFYVMIRQGSAAKDLDALLPAVNANNARKFMFCTDDKHIDELMERGSIDDHIRLAVKQGMDPLQAIQIATLNACECYGFSDKGAIAPGYQADFILLNDLSAFEIDRVYKNGECVAKNGELLVMKEIESDLPAAVKNTVTIPKITPELLKIQANPSGEALTIELTPHSLVTGKKQFKLPVKESFFEADPTQDVWKMAVVERHHNTGNIGLGFIKGLGLAGGAIAGTIAHDSHNLVAAGDSDEDLALAIQHAAALGGGLVVVRNGQILGELSLDIGGLMSSKPVAEVLRGLKQVDQALEKLGFQGEFHPFSALSFMCLPVIPSLKLTDMGYFDSDRGEHVPV
ncbi:adenine deaminase [Salisediminibacterium beveridgei]|uniref:Adenine deaminase n=1 Tax=Salisediminibacterium beveridgei TaxID=632773 RepID=A0A1D7QXI8_9BACI|nr:adenine deaminase [Salisediminibacterium beveridgei]AOM83720.1 Adenine deaminase [Salisediminibacterium beveridgei]